MQENEVLSNYGDALAKCAANQSLNVQGIMEPLKGLIAAGDSSRKKLIFNLDNFDADFSNAPAPSALAMPLKN